MSFSSVGKHAGAGSTNHQLVAPEPSFAERARTLVYLGRIGSLSTHSLQAASVIRLPADLRNIEISWNVHCREHPLNFQLFRRNIACSLDHVIGHLWPAVWKTFIGVLRRVVD